MLSAFTAARVGINTDKFDRLTRSLSGGRAIADESAAPRRSHVGFLFRSARLVLAVAVPTVPQEPSTGDDAGTFSAVRVRKAML